VRIDTGLGRPSERFLLQPGRNKVSATPNVGWHKSRKCDTGSCVEAARIDGVYALRDSAEPEVVLRFSARDWAAFTTAIRAGEYDRR
jgi:hypothetical protein